jgi:alkylation response protein AidB-like acyl-CoA dehydrogenase
VDVGFSESQLELRAAVRDVLAKECPPALVRTCLDEPEAWRPLWQRAVDLGWTGLALLDDDAGMGVIELVAVLEELGAAAAPIPLLSSAGLAAGALRACGSGALQWREELAEGAVGALAVETAPGVVDASRADLYVVVSGQDLSVVRPGAGVDLVPLDAVDPARPMSRLTLGADASVEATFPVSVPAVLTIPLTATAAELVGLASRVLDVAVTHASTREQFDRVIGSFQGIKHRLADCYVAIERARGLTYAAAMLAGDPGADEVDAWRAAALAKAAAGDAASETTRAGVQVLGALGMTWEHDMHLYLRRAWQMSPVLGDSATLYRDAASSLVGAR